MPRKPDDRRESHGGRGHVLVATDKFKGSLRAFEVVERVTAGVRRAAPTVEVVSVPVADGGDGTLDAALSRGFARREVAVSGPTGQPVDAAIGVRGATAVVELAQASGLALLPHGRFAPLTATSRGVGELIRAALDAGCREIILGVGGSAGMDGGAGMLQGLGARLLDADGADIPPGGAALARLRRLDLSDLDPRLASVRIVLACDVDNPLLGPCGAVGTYGAQKGVDPSMQDQLEQALSRWASFLPPGAADRPGAGAAGGVGVAALAVLGARFRYGADVVLELVGFAAELAGAQLVVTGEGRLDQQTGFGKAPAIVAAAARGAEVPVVAICGHSTLTDDERDELGIAQVYALSVLEPDPDESMARAGDLVERVAGDLAHDWLARAPGPSPAEARS